MANPKTLSILTIIATVQVVSSSENGHKAPRSPEWARFASNINYRLTAELEVNGGSAHFNQDDNDGVSPGFTIPIDVLMVQDPKTGRYRQRVSFFSGLEVDYNDDGLGWKAITARQIFESDYDDDDQEDQNGDDDDDDWFYRQESGDRMCYRDGGVKDLRIDDYYDDGYEEEPLPYLNFFPSMRQMANYNLSDIITTEPGIPYRIATLGVPNNPNSYTFNHTSLGKNDVVPPDSSFELHYEVASSSFEYVRPLKWIMLARNQVFYAHTDRWVLRYTHYETIETKEEKKLWEEWFDVHLKNDCGEYRHRLAAGRKYDARKEIKINRLGMLFSSSYGGEESLFGRYDPTEIHTYSHHSYYDYHQMYQQKSIQTMDPFDLFLTRYNKQYPTLEEYRRRKEIHDANLEMIHSLNAKHKGHTIFKPNQYLDMEVHEVMRYRGGGSPLPNNHLNAGNADSRHGTHSRSSKSFGKSHDDTNEHVVIESGYYHTTEEFDQSSLPKSFDWRTHLPGSVGPIKDQGFCGSCWSFSLASSLESHWFITHSQSVTLPEQFIMDCVWTDFSWGCYGGNFADAAWHIIDNFGGNIPTREHYGGYLSIDGMCYLDILEELGMTAPIDAHQKSGRQKMENDITTIGREDSKKNVSDGEGMPPPTIQLEDWLYVRPRDDISTKHALFHKGPLSVFFRVVESSVYFSSGVLDVEDCTRNDIQDLNHAINLVGWGVDIMEDGTEAEHWILRNSWSRFWGDEGYFKVRMGERDCGVTTAPGMPVVATKEPALDLFKSKTQVNW